MFYNLATSTLASGTRLKPSVVPCSHAVGVAARNMGRPKKGAAVDEVPTGGKTSSRSIGNLQIWWH